MGDVSNFLTFRLPLTAYRFAGFKAPAARSRPLRGVQSAFGAFKAASRGSRRLWRVQGRFAAFKVQSRFAAFKAPAARSRFKIPLREFKIPNSRFKIGAGTPFGVGPRNISSLQFIRL